MTSSECRARIEAAHTALAAVFGDAMTHPAPATESLREAIAQLRPLSAGGPLPPELRDSLQDFQNKLRMGQHWNAEGLRTTTERMQWYAERLAVAPAASYQSTGAGSEAAWELHSRFAVEG